MNEELQNRNDTNLLSARQSTWKYHVCTALTFYFIIGTFGINFRYFWRPVYLLQRYPLHFFANWLLAFSISYLLSLPIRRKNYHFALMCLFALFFATISREKFEALGLPLLAIDLSLSKYSGTLLEYFSLRKALFFLYGAIVPFVAIHIRIKGKSLYQKMNAFPKLLLKEKKTLIAIAMALPIWIGLLRYGKFVLLGFALFVRPHVPRTDYLGNGDIVAFTLSIYSSENIIAKYSHIRPELLAALDSKKTNNFIDPSCKTSEQPDILVVMVESMFDPIQIPKITLSEDPLGPLRAMGFEENDSYFFVPSYGGATANTEFEFLTGSTHRFFPLGTVQYQHNLYTPTNSLVHMLEPKNYYSMAIHNYFRYFWRRNEVYPLLGFKEFYGLEDIQKFVKVDKYDNQKPSDKALVKFVPEQMKKHQKSPGFYFVVTMGTHGPYEKYFGHSESKIKIKKSGVIESYSESELENYSNFLADSSKALSDLFRFALGRSKPTVVVYFGDHLPGLAEETYDKTGYADWMKRATGLLSDEKKVVPIKVLNNFGCKIKLPKAIASNCMATYLVSQLYPDLPQDQFWKFNQEFCKKNPFIYDNTDVSSLHGDLADYAGLIYKNLFNFLKNAPQQSPQVKSHQWPQSQHK